MFVIETKKSKTHIQTHIKPITQMLIQQLISIP